MRSNSAAHLGHATLVESKRRSDHAERSDDVARCISDRCRDRRDALFDGIVSNGDAIVVDIGGKGAPEGRFVTSDGVSEPTHMADAVAARCHGDVDRFVRIHCFSQVGGFFGGVGECHQHRFCQSRQCCRCRETSGDSEQFGPRRPTAIDAASGETGCFERTDLAQCGARAELDLASQVGQRQPVRTIGDRSDKAESAVGRTGSVGARCLRHVA